MTRYPTGTSDTKRRAWSIAVSLFLMNILVYGSTFGTMGVFVAPLIERYGLSHARVGSLTTATTLMFALFSPISGYLLESIEARVIIVVGAVLSLCGFVVASVAKDFDNLLSAYLILGAGLGLGTLTPVAVVITRWFKEQRGAPMGLAIAGTSVGGMVLIPLVNHIIGTHGLRAAYQVMALAIALAIPIVLMATKGSPRATASEIRISLTPSLKQTSGYTVLEAAATRSFWMIILALLFFGFQTEGTAIHMIPHVVSIGYSTRRAAIVLSATMGLGAAGKFAMGALSDRIGAKATLVIAFISSAIGEILLLGGAAPVCLVFAIVALGIGWGSQGALFPILVAECFGLKRFAVLQGLTSFVLYAGVGIGPMVIGWLFDLSGKYTVSFECCAAAAVLAALATLACRPLEPTTPILSELNLAVTR